MSKNVLSPYIKSLILDKPNLTPEDLSLVLRAIYKGSVSQVQAAAFLTALRVRGVDQQAEFIAAAAATSLEHAYTIPKDKVSAAGYIDIVGTGGDGQNTFNVSTSAAIVAAGIGLPVCKHGGKASTSKSGSGDLLKCLGVDLSAVTAETTASIVDKTKFCYLFAPLFHPVMATVAPVRAELGIPTIFNILGPLINPIPLQARILGVYSEKLGESYADAAAKLLPECKTLVVYGEVGLDEISPIGSTKCWLIENGSIETFSLAPKDFGLPEHSLDDVRSGTPEENAAILLKILNQDDEEFTIKDSNHPLVDYILMNAGALAHVAGYALSWKEGVELAKQAIVEKKALAELNNFKAAISQL